MKRRKNPEPHGPIPRQGMKCWMGPLFLLAFVLEAHHIVSFVTELSKIADIRQTIDVVKIQTLAGHHVVALGPAKRRSVAGWKDLLLVSFL
jgi:hypothetical protein